MTNNAVEALYQAVNSYLEYEYIVENDEMIKLLSYALNYYLMEYVRSLKHFAETSGRNSIISLDFFYFVPQILTVLHSSNTYKTFQKKVTTPLNEYKRCAPPSEHAYRFSKTKGLRLDDLFNVRKRKTQQTQQIEASLMRVIHQANFNYDA